jgi:cell division protein FtsI/penicillin-binding protein 2
MLRRTAIPVLFAGWAWGEPSQLGRFFDAGQGAALLVDLQTRRVLGVHRPNVAAAEMLPPGSTLKPLVLSALLRRKKIAPAESFACPGKLIVAGRQLNCSHPRLSTPLDISAALAYSCNFFVARCAERFHPGELSADLTAAGLTSRTGLLDAEGAGRLSTASPQLQALGEDGVLVTAAGLAIAYRQLARSCAAPVLDGLEGAVEFGTAQRARIDGLKVAGKTGSVRAASGARVAWFAGFAPSRSPEVVVVVMLQGRSGGADAAPVAGRILESYRAGRL